MIFPILLCQLFAMHTYLQVAVMYRRCVGTSQTVEIAKEIDLNVDYTAAAAVEEP